jgi:hypothetical protein
MSSRRTFPVECGNGKAKQMQEAAVATYRYFADQCRLMAKKKSMPEEGRRMLLEHADEWIKLAEETERAQQSLTAKMGRC